MEMCPLNGFTFPKNLKLIWINDYKSLPSTADYGRLKPFPTDIQSHLASVYFEEF